jgi:hypothetical protein
MILVAVILLVGTILFSVLHTQIDKALQPAGNWLKARSWGWIIPVAIIFVMSFPPLFGQEIVGILVGDFYGLGIGFLIVALGTLLGELANFL